MKNKVPVNYIRSSKEQAIESLESIAHWMKVSAFDYDPQDLSMILDKVKENYNIYLKNK